MNHLIKYLKKTDFSRINVNLIQRDDFNNHFGWLLKEIKLTETIIAIAEK